MCFNFNVYLVCGLRGVLEYEEVCFCFVIMWRENVEFYVVEWLVEFWWVVCCMFVVFLVGWWLVIFLVDV